MKDVDNYMVLMLEMTNGIRRVVLQDVVPFTEEL